MVAAAEFNEVFDETVGKSVIAVGGWQRGRRVFFADGELMAGILRTEHRWIPPAELTLVVRRTLMRDMDDVVPSEPPTNPQDYPVRIAPSHARSLLSDRWRYSSSDRAATPRVDTIPYPSMTVEQCRQTLQPMALTLRDTLPRLSQWLTAERLLDRLRADGSDWWIEQRWIADLEAEIQARG